MATLLMALLFLLAIFHSAPQMSKVEPFTARLHPSALRLEVQPKSQETLDVISLVQRKQLISDGTGSDFFGYSMASSADTLVIGAWGTSVNGNDEQGAAYIFERNQGGANQWGLVKKLVASDGMATDRFGLAVAIDGDTVAVGALFANVGVNSEQGAVYLFERNLGGSNQWGESKKVVASDGVASDFFGSSVAIAGDLLVVGGWGSGTGSNDEQGVAYLFTRNQGGLGNWGELKKLSASDAKANDKFGYAVSLSADTVAIGAWGADIEINKEQGAVYLFAKDQGGVNNWGELKKLTASDGAAVDTFGNALSLDGETLVVGSVYADVNGKMDQGAAYIFQRNQGGEENWGELKKLTASDGLGGDFFGASIILGGDTLLIGAWGDDRESNRDQGSVYRFEHHQGGTNQWGEVQQLISDNGVANDNFGYSVAIAGDWVAIGAWSADIAGQQNQGTAYLFAPENQSPLITAQSFAIDENSVNGSVVGTVNASDPDVADILVFAITGGNANSAFAINSNSGELSVNNSSALDSETTTAILLTVTVTDNGVPPISSSAPITVHLNNLDDIVRTLSINDIAVDESIGSAIFTVTLSAAKATTITVDYATSDATATADSDYSAVNGKLSFSPGAITRTILVPILEDGKDESDESFVVNLSSPVNATLSDGTGIATIFDNDESSNVNMTVSKSVNVVSAKVGDTVTYSYQIENTGAVSLSISALDDKLGTINTVISPGGSALLPGSFLKPGQVAVATKNYKIQAHDLPGPLRNTFIVTGTTPASAQVLRSTQASVALLVKPLPMLSIHDLFVGEHADSAQFSVTLTSASDASVSVHYASRNGTASAGDDYDSVSGTLTIPAGATQAIIPIPIRDDSLIEGDESFFVTLSMPVNARLDDAEARGTILDDDEQHFVNFEISKSATPKIVNVGETIRYRYQITNTGTLSLTIAANDDKLGTLTFVTVPGGTTLSSTVALVPGEVAQIVKNYTVQSTDLPGPLINTLTVTGTTQSAIQIVKSVQESVMIKSPSQNKIYLPIIQRSAAN